MTTVPPIPMPATDWWADRGLAVLLIGIIVAVCLIALREWWKVRRPHVLRMQELDATKEEKACRLYDTLSEVVPQQHALLERIDERQEAHARACEDGEQSARENGQLLRQIANKVLSQ